MSQREYKKQWYAANRERILEKARRRNAENRSLKLETKTEYPTEIDSLPFYGLRYEITAGHLLITDRKNGQICMELRNVRDFAQEIMEIADVWGEGMNLKEACYEAGADRAGVANLPGKIGPPCRASGASRGDRA